MNNIFTKIVSVILILLIKLMIFDLTDAICVSQNIRENIKITGSLKKPIILNVYTDFKELNNVEKKTILYSIDYLDIQQKLNNYRVIYGLGQLGHAVIYYFFTK